jgi:hypothetical protein
VVILDHCESKISLTDTFWYRPLMPDFIEIRGIFTRIKLTNGQKDMTLPACIHFFHKKIEELLVYYLRLGQYIPS